MNHVYAIGRTNDDIIRQLGHPEPGERLKAARTAAALHIYLALPEVVLTARSDADPGARATARDAVVALLRSEVAAERALAGFPPLGNADRDVDAAAVIALFKRYVAARTDRDYSKPFTGPSDEEIREAAFRYLADWSGVGAEARSGVQAAADRAVGAIARHIEIPPQRASNKFASYRDAITRVDEYETARGAAEV